MPERFGCSDCYAHSNDFELFKKHIPQSLIMGTPRAGEDDSAQVVSPDGTKIYYQKGPQGVEPPEQTHSTTLYQIDLATGKESALVMHKGDCPRIDCLRASPDGKKLAYHVTFGCGFIGTPEIYVLDLATGKSEEIALGYGTMHWASTSDRLYFYRRMVEAEREREDYLWVAEFDKSKPAAETKPAGMPSAQTNPAGEPAKDGH